MYCFLNEIQHEDGHVILGCLALYYYCDLTLSQDIWPMGTQFSYGFTWPQKLKILYNKHHMKI